MSAIELLALSFGFVLLNGLFVAAEFALIAAPKTAIEHSATGGNRLAARLLALLESPQQQDRYMATAQLGITLASLGLGMYSEHELARVLEPYVGRLGPFETATLASLIALAFLTFIHVVFGEMVPKSLALQRPDRLARLFYTPMRITLFILYPLVRLSSGIAIASLRAIGIRRRDRGAEELHTPEELQLIVEESARGGALRDESSRLLRELFEFGDLTAAQVMVPRVRIVGIPVGALPAEVRQLLTKHPHTRYPVYEGDLDHIVGMLHVKDLLRRLILNERIGAAEVRPIPFVPETAALDDVLTTMQRAHAHMAVVIDEHGGTAGLVSLEDLFEEVVGDLDEDVSESPILVPEAGGAVRASGTVRLDELGQYFNVDLEHEDVDSVSGLVLARLGRPPVVGDVVQYGRLQLEVTATSGRGVQEVRATLLPEQH